MNIQIATAYLNGWRQVVIYARGSKWIAAVEAATLANVKIPCAEERHLRDVTDDPQRLRRLRQRLDARRKLYRRSARPPHHSPEIIKQIVAEIGT